MSTAISVQGDQDYWTPRQVDVLHSMGMQGTNAELMAFLAYCQNTGLDPFSRQIYMIVRQTKNGPQATIQTGIDGFRLIAERSGEYEGPEGPFWCGPDGVWVDVWLPTDQPPAAARFGVNRRGFKEPVWGTVTWAEFGSTKGLWAKMGPHMLAKVAESHALRKAFPQQMSGLYTADEMHSTPPRAQDTYTAPRREHPIPKPTTAPKPAQERTGPPRDVDYDNQRVATDTGEIIEAEIIDEPIITAMQVKKLHAQLGELNVKDRDQKLALITAIIGHPVETSNHLTKDEARTCIERLEDACQAKDPAGALAFILEAGA